VKRLIIIGAGGHGKVCAEIARDMEQWSEIVFLDDEKENSLLDFPILGPVNIEKYVDNRTNFFVAIGDNIHRREIYHRISMCKGHLATLIDTNAIISDYSKIGQGSVIMPGVIVNAKVSIGQGCIVNTGSIIEHDSFIEDFVHLSPNATVLGSVHVGSLVWIGAGTTVLNNLSISENIVVGANSLVLNNLENQGLYFGNPCKIYRSFT